MSKTYGQMMEEALAIKNQKQADIWFKGEVDAMKKVNPTWDIEKCSNVVRSNLGYMAGYYDKKASIHVNKFFGAGHPIFGGPGYWDSVTAESAFELGKKMGAKKMICRHLTHEFKCNLTKMKCPDKPFEDGHCIYGVYRDPGLQPEDKIAYYIAIVIVIVVGMTALLIKSLIRGF